MKNDIVIWKNKIYKLKQTSYKFASINTEIKNALLAEIKTELLANTEIIINTNKIDVKKAETKKLQKSLIDRLTLTPQRIDEMIKGIDTIISLEDPVNKVIEEWTRPQRSSSSQENQLPDLKIKKVRVPLGVVFMIYESRPNVTVDSTTLCIKSGNCVILRGGSETINTNKILVNLIKTAINNVWKKYNINFSNDIVLFIDNPSYKLLYQLLKLETLIDIVIPRGSEKMIQKIKEEALIPVLSHGSGVCHTYVDETADIEKSVKVCLNAKVQRPGVCNAMEKLLVHKNIAEKFLPQMAKIYLQNKVELRGCPKTKLVLKKHNIKIIPAKEDDWYKEYLDLVLTIKIVDNIDEAIEHINKYGSHHSDAIMTNDENNKQKFITEVDSSAVFINSSTRLHDGGVFGFGAEIGISTSKLHSRGTMGIKELTTTKYVVEGDGNIRE